MAEALLKTVDLTDCDREPVHIPGSIQPFGFLIAFALPTWAVAHVSTNAADVFSVVSADAMIGKPMETVLPPSSIHDLRNVFQAAMISGLAERLADVSVGRGQARYDILIHGSGQLAIAEFIPCAGADTVRGDATTLVKTVIDRLRRTTSFQAFLTSAARQIRAVTGFDRVMLYKFEEDDSGVVVSEALRAGMPPFLNLHYPASDIPAQSRALFKRQWLRFIPDVNYTPVPVIPALNEKGQPLDLSLSTLRSTSPIHLQYLRNMGSTATMTVSIMQGDRLWGLIACHHDSPRRVSATTCAAMELLAQVVSTQIEAKQQTDALAEITKAHEIHDRLIASMQPEETIFQNLRRFSALIQEMISCDGIGVWTGGRFEAEGLAPPKEAIGELIRFLDGKPSGRVFATDMLSRHIPGASLHSQDVSGLLAIPFSREPRDLLMLFRREVVQTVSWGGDPNKAVQPGGIEIKGTGHRLSPRTSFAAWKETVRDKSLPWRGSEISIAETLRVSLLDVILRRANIIDRERRTAQDGQLVLVAELNHRVKNVLTVIRSLVRQSQQGATSLEAFTGDLQSRIHALAVAHDQLTLAHWKAAPLQTLIEAEAEAWTTTNDVRVSFSGPSVMIEARAYQTLALVLHEMMTNAAKYGALSVASGRLAIAWTLERTGDLVLSWTESGVTAVKPSKRGFGTIVIEQSIPFELQGEAAIEYRPEGVYARFTIPRGFVTKSEGPAATLKPLKAAPRIDLKGKNLLLVEDSMMIALDAQAMLQSCGAEVEIAATTSDARRALKLNVFDAAILDVNLYIEDSFPVAADLQERAIPFIFATGYGETIVVPERFKDVQVISKPYAEDTLRAALAA